MRVALLLSLLVAACASKQPPRGPDYDPVNSPEAPTACPDERAAAQEAREEVLERGDEASRARATESVFLHAECERRAFEELRLPRADEAALMERLMAVRDRYRDAGNLYSEVLRADLAPWSPRALAGQGSLDHAFARTLRAAPTPVDRRGAEEERAFRDEIDELASQLTADAIAGYQAALAAGIEGAWKDAACAGLADLGAEHARC